jgi:hypothetical protein
MSDPKRREGESVDISPLRQGFIARENPFTKHMHGDGEPTSFVHSVEAIRKVKKWDLKCENMDIPKFIENAPIEKRHAILDLIEEYNKDR